MMKRNAIEDLMKWKDSEERKPMVLKGARQVGKMSAAALFSQKSLALEEEAWYNGTVS